MTFRLLPVIAEITTVPLEPVNVTVPEEVLELEELEILDEEETDEELLEEEIEELEDIELELEELELLEADSRSTISSTVTVPVPALPSLKKNFATESVAVGVNVKL